MGLQHNANVILVAGDPKPRHHQCLRTVSLSLWLQIVKQNALLTECTQQKAVEYLQMMTGTVNCEFKLAAQSLQYLQR